MSISTGDIVFFEGQVFYVMEVTQIPTVQDSNLLYLKKNQFDLDETETVLFDDDVIKINKIDNPEYFL